MYYHLSDHIYITQFQGELILLDTKLDKYTVCFQQTADTIMSVLEETHCNVANKPSGTSFALHDLPNLQILIDGDIIEKQEVPFPFYIDRKIDSKGVSGVDWTLPLENKKVRVSMQVLQALGTLIKVNFYIKVRGFYNTIQLIKRSQKPHETYIIPSDESLRDLANIVNKTCLIYPTRTKCLEWAMTFVLLALKRNWKCNLEIGVQNYPFMAHAWVECDGKTVMDSQELRTGLGIILNEPFRKLKV